jgi:hypothetical protein
MAEQADICAGLEGQKYDGKHRSRWVDNIKTDLNMKRM